MTAASIEQPVKDRYRDPWRTVEGIDFRSLTVEASKGKEGPCLERLQAVVYKGFDCC